ncbi:MAG: hypothetical protein JSR37_06635 [Verrucomicrobia bacterium]|nr:hypothetical protein [Verrucomicrobiota bacterium]MBS0636536.1 hypothetical protein [Verrucomicrobiota bacterium]
MIYTVGHDSPPRYLIQGAKEENEEEIDFKAMRELRTQKLADAIKSAPSEYTFELEIRFTNVYKLPEVRIQTLKASSFQVLEDKIISVFNATAKNPVYFSYNHQAYYSKCSLFVTGPFTNNVRARLSHSAQYVETADPSYTISSLDLMLRASLQLPSEEALRALKPPAARRLIFSDAPRAVDAYKSGNEVKLGAILQVETVQIEIPLQ